MIIPVTLEELHMFHHIDRQIFSRLVFNLACDPAQCLLVMSMWMWLEEMKFPCIINKMLRLPDFVVNELVEEATRCLDSLGSRNPEENNEGDMPVTSLTLEQNISTTMFYPCKFTMISGVKAFLKKVCVIVFADMLQRIFPGRAIFNEPLRIPGFPNPVFGDITVIPRTLDYTFYNHELWGWSINFDSSDDDRTLFLTFSRGYPVSEEEVRSLFTFYYGDCVERVEMDSSDTSLSQSLYARMVVRNVSTVDEILGRDYIAKLRVNGKHVWARKYERRDP